MKKLDRFERMPVEERRQFLKALSIALASPLIPIDLRFACNEIVLGKTFAEAQAAQRPTFFIEINLRDQWDFASLMAAPGLATYPNLRRGNNNGVALYDDPNSLARHPNGVFLTREGRHLEPHIDTVACVELCELSMGEVHGHEAGNAVRSPGRGYNAGAGRTPMWLLDPRGGRISAEDHYSSTPTPAVIHNYTQRQLDRSIRTGVAYKGINRGISMACYHFAAHLNDAQIDRFQNTDSIVAAFANVTPPSNVVTRHAGLITDLIHLVDENFASRFRLGRGAEENHYTQLQGLTSRLGTTPPIFNLRLTPQERADWGNGVPHDGHPDDRGKAQLWEQMAFASKLVTNRVVRTVALEFDYEDVHSGRDEAVLRAMGLQVAMPLARLIQSLKDAGIYDDTVIACYTLDGGRSPISASSGNEGKNGVLLAGGKIRGGYYGDIRVVGFNGERHEFSYHKVDEATGQPVPNGDRGNGGRNSGGSIWKTICKAMGVPASLYNSFPDVRDEPEMNFLLRS
ncbi:MAG: DUF1501 domain-containing protein [Bdellovibrionia bacterium]